MISKENFIKYINELHELNIASYELNEVLQKLGSDNEFYLDNHEILIVNILRDIFDDKENDWIGYALYELDWFERYEDGMIKDGDGGTIHLRDAGDLYDLLIRSMELNNVQ